ncbi:class I SAM-dependent methyltransferase [Conexibacter sp. JD483]|uniref:class I SAM-dependent methyltransferase n=1 Tax=unclassified Conexibacter TaxID=2627773 RepID=UPI002721094A|nr:MULTISPECIES: class I SAM-dependent methyltransferase [unclassified Conexibacter]MDO8184057.1 class I SAM-dependent methyltransferase [Conexibacter sp. CPCC 205706]MDO8197049.1 class I SAM-dependent methyltransferase [Conexibacter sp. CPCC 205762]MDR9367965.1 class I SAM-dependent methyltransferase [Conexibacter sp. JD483]
MFEICRTCGGAVQTSALLAPLPFVTCERCGFTFRVDRAEEDVHAIYEEGAYSGALATLYSDPATLRNRRRDARVRLDFIAPHAPRGARLLDVGAAGGAFVEQAIARGYAAEGVEPTPEFAAFARDSLGVPVRATTVEQAGLEEASLDVVTIWHVLEHIPDPVDVLGLLLTALRPGGAIAIEVPNAGGHLALSQGREWASLQPEVHVNQFGPRSLAAALERAGFEVVDVSSVTVTPYLRRGQRLQPGQVVHRLRGVQKLRTVSSTHPHGHELLRAIGRRPAAAQPAASASS